MRAARVGRGGRGSARAFVRHGRRGRSGRSGACPCPCPCPVSRVPLPVSPAPYPRDDSGGAARGAPQRREVRRGGLSRRRMEQAGDALEEVLSKALSQRSLTLGVYEAAKLLNV